MARIKPVAVHAKAFFGCFLLLAFSLGFSWALPFVFVSCQRDGQRVGCEVEQRMLGLIPFDVTEIHDLQRASSYLETGTRTGSTRTTDTHYLVFTDAQGNDTRFLGEAGDQIGGVRGKSMAEDINAYIESSDPEFSTWTVPLLGYAPLVPAGLAMIFFALVSWDFIANRVRAITTGPTVDDP